MPVAPIAYIQTREKHAPRKPREGKECRQKIRSREKWAAENERNRGGERGGDTGAERAHEKVHPRRADEEMDQDVKAEAEVEITKENQPLAGIENLVLRICERRLPAGIVRIPERQRAVRHDAMDHALRREVVARNVADEEAAPRKEHVRERGDDERREQRERSPISATRRSRCQRPRLEHPRRRETHTSASASLSSPSRDIFTL